VQKIWRIRKIQMETETRQWEFVNPAKDSGERYERRQDAQAEPNGYQREIWDIIDWYLYLRTGGYHG